MCNSQKTFYHWIFFDRFKGRIYDTCVSLENNGVPWCATRTNLDNEYIGYYKDCGPLCDVNNCPIGFHRSYIDESCYQVCKM